MGSFEQEKWRSDLVRKMMMVSAVRRRKKMREFCWLVYEACRLELENVRSGKMVINFG